MLREESNNQFNMTPILFLILLPCITADVSQIVNAVLDLNHGFLTTKEGNTTDPINPSTPSPTCRSIVEVRNPTLPNAKEWVEKGEKCVTEYLFVRAAHETFEATIDEQGNICGDYFVNLDRLQIVSEAYKYVRHLWGKANCNSCFMRVNGSITKTPTEQTLKFDNNYRRTKNCFKKYSGEAENVTCTACLDLYNNLTDVYIDIEDTYRDAVCMDIVDTMNITRFIWSDRGCVKREGVPIPLKIGMGFMTLLPVTFYLLAYFLAHKQEAPILQQKRLAEVFAVNSGSASATEGGSSNLRNHFGAIRRNQSTGNR